MARKQEAENSAEFTFNPPPRRASLPVLGKLSAWKSLRSSMVLTIVGGVFGLFVLLLVGFFVVLQLP
jgi:hypothetical protein